VLRVWALYDRARWVLYFFFSTSVVMISIGLWAILGTRSGQTLTQEHIGCNLGFSSKAYVLRYISHIAGLLILVSQWHAWVNCHIIGSRAI
jgi:hypothetical protein